MRVTECGWLRSGLTGSPVGGGEERLREGGVGEGGGEVVGVCVVGSVVGESQEMEDGGSPSHSSISLINIQSVSWLKLNVIRISSGFSGTVYVFLVSVLLVEEKEQLSGVTVASTLGLISVAISVVPGGRILAEGRLKKYTSM